MAGQDSEWQFAGSAREGEAFEIRGVDVWGQGWQVAAGEGPLLGVGGREKVGEWSRNVDEMIIM